MPATIQSITREQLQSRVRGAKPVQVVNVLEPQYYHLGLIPGSKRIPLSQLERRMHELDRSVEVVAYCASSRCDASHRAARELMIYGFDVKVLEGGIESWREAGLPTEDLEASTICETCGNDYSKPLIVILGGRRHVYDCFECAIQALAPSCAHCGCKIIGHGVEADGKFFCCSHCSHEVAFGAVRERRGRATHASH